MSRVAGEPLGVLLLSGSHDRAHYAFVLPPAPPHWPHRRAVRDQPGCLALQDWSALDDAARDARLRAAVWRAWTNCGRHRSTGRAFDRLRGGIARRGDQSGVDCCPTWQ